jgi:hypothetical protein
MSTILATDHGSRCRRPAGGSAPPASTWEFWGRVLVLPYLLVFAVFVLYPVGYGLWLARHPSSYEHLFADPIFFRTAINTVVFLVVAINIKMLDRAGALRLLHPRAGGSRRSRCCSSCRGRCLRSPPSCRCASC